MKRRTVQKIKKHLPIVLVIIMISSIFITFSHLMPEQTMSERKTISIFVTGMSRPASIEISNTSMLNILRNYFNIRTGIFNDNIAVVCVNDMCNQVSGEKWFFLVNGFLSETPINEYYPNDRDFIELRFSAPYNKTFRLSINVTEHHLFYTGLVLSNNETLLELAQRFYSIELFENTTKIKCIGSLCNQINGSVWKVYSDNVPLLNDNMGLYVPTNSENIELKYE